VGQLDKWNIVTSQVTARPSTGGDMPGKRLLFFRLRARNTRKVDELVGLTSLSSSVRKHPLLVLRAVDDEASLALAAAQNLGLATVFGHFARGIYPRSVDRRSRQICGP
jgi:hypothetical protein